MNFQMPRLCKSSLCLSGKHAALAGVILSAGVAILPLGVPTVLGAATPTPAPTVAPTASPAATPDDAPVNRNYDGTQQANYIKTANDAFVEARGAKTSAFIEANNAYLQAGGASGQGLDSKDAIKARREMIAKAIQANEECLTFTGTQETFYHDELAKTPLIKADVDGLTTSFAEHAKTADVVKLRQTTGDMLKTGDKMMEFLENKYGAWKLSGNKPVFKKTADAKEYSTLGKKYNTDVESVQKLGAAVNAPLPTPGASPVSSVSPSPGGVAQPQATVGAATVSPAPKAKP